MGHKYERVSAEGSIPFDYVRRTTSGQVLNGAGIFGGIMFQASGGGTLTIYDNPAATGTVIMTVTYAASVYNIPFPRRGVSVNNGIYVDVGAAMTAITIYYLDDPEL